MSYCFPINFVSFTPQITKILDWTDVEKKCNTLFILNTTVESRPGCTTKGTFPKMRNKTQGLMKESEPLKVIPAPAFTATHGSVSGKGGIQEEHMFPGALSTM